MEENNFEYDAFLNYASEDAQWCEKLANHLREEGVYLWFDKWELQYGDRIGRRINDGIEKSRKMICVLSDNYVRDDKVYNRYEVFKKLSIDPNTDRLLIPIIYKKCNILSPFDDILSIDFSAEEDYDLRLRQLVESLELQQKKSIKRDEIIPPAGKPSISKINKQRIEIAKKFVEKVFILYEFLGYSVEKNIQVNDTKIDIKLKRKLPGITKEESPFAIIECKDKRVTANDVQQIYKKRYIIEKHFIEKSLHCIVVSSQGFEPKVRENLMHNHIFSYTYSELLSELMPLGSYVDNLISKYETWRNERWRGEDWFIRPNLKTDITYEVQPSLRYIYRWLGDTRANLLTILGDLGTGKTTLVHFLAYNLAINYREDPLRHPAPVIIQLKEVRKEVCLEGIIINHLSKYGLTNIDFQSFEYLVQQGKIIVLFDAFDEMAERVKWMVTQENFYELSRLAVQQGKVILTCCTNYFKDRKEQQNLMEGPTSSETDTDLYKELKQKPGTEVVYLKEFDEDQIYNYIKKARPDTVDEDWKKIRRVYNLKDLAQRPLLLYMIVKYLPRLDENEEINAATLYDIYTSEWIEREERRKHPLDLLNKDTRLDLMYKLAWRMWNEEKYTIHNKEILAIVNELISNKIIEYGDEEAEGLSREIQACTFFKRDKDGNFSFLHQSFMEYFLARKLYDEAIRPESYSSIKLLLNTRRIGQKTIFFFSLLDKEKKIYQSLSAILTGGYIPKVSENALQILYWSVRSSLGMGENISNIEELRRAMKETFPCCVDLKNARLQEAVLEGVFLDKVNFTGADLTKANLNNASFVKAVFQGALITEARCINSVFLHCNFKNANLKQTNFSEAILEDVDLKDADTSQTIIEDPLPHIEPGTKSKLSPVVQLGHDLDVITVSYSPDGQHFATSSNDSNILLWHAGTGRLIRVFKGHTAPVTFVHFCPDGELLASGSGDRTVRLWVVKTGVLLRTIKGHKEWVNSVLFSPSGKILASGSSDRTIMLWDVKTGKSSMTMQGHKGWVNSVHFSPDGKFLASGSGDRTVRLWDVETGRSFKTIEGYKSWVKSVRFSPDGKILASVSGDKTVRLWDVETGEPKKTPGYRGEVNSLHFCPDGDVLASGDEDGSVKLWDIKSEKFIKELKGHTGPVNSVNFSSDGEILASCSNDRTVRLWQRNSGKSLRVIKMQRNAVNSVHTSLDGRFLASGSSDRTVRLWEINKEKSLHVMEGHREPVNSVYFSPDSKILASGSSDMTVRLWDVEERKILHVIGGHKDAVKSVRFSPDGEILATASSSSDKTIKLWEVKSATFKKELKGHTDYVNSINFSPDGEILASGSRDRTIKLWEVKSGTIISELKEHTGTINSIQFSPDGEFLASGGGDRTIRLWDISYRPYRCIRELKEHKGSVNFVSFSPDGKTLVSCSDDRIIRLWSVKNGQCIMPLKGHSGRVISVSFAPNGKYLISVGTTGRLLFWDIEKGIPFLYNYVFGPGAWLNLLPDGHFDASPEGMKYLCYTMKDSLKSYTAEELRKEFLNREAVKKVVDGYMT